MGLEKSTDRSSHLEVASCFGSCDFRGVGTRCFRHMFEIAPSRPVEFKMIKLDVQQSIVLATRRHPTSTTFYYCNFEDRGTAFVDALENRASSFGSLEIDGRSTFSDVNFRRLLQLDNVIDELSLLGFSGELAFLPFSAKVRRLECEIMPSTLPVVDLDSLSIVDSLDVVARQLSIRILHYANGSFPTDAVLSFFKRLADLGHFTELKLRFWINDNDFDLPVSFVQAVTRTALANANLQILDLSTLEDDEDLGWNSHLSTLFEGLQHHEELSILKLKVHDDAFGPNFCHLRRFLSNNRHITVTDREGRVCSDGASIDKLYALNRLYLGSVDLVTKSFSERSSLVATTLMESASSEFQRCALLLSHHTDALYDLVQFARFEEVGGGENEDSSHAASNNVPRRKRQRRRIQQ